jgi:hypothetical protein
MFDWKDRTVSTTGYQVSELKNEAFSYSTSTNRRAVMTTSWRREKVTDGTRLVGGVRKKILILVFVVMVVVVVVLVAVVATSVLVLSEDSQCIVTFILSYRLVPLL